MKVTERFLGYVNFDTQSNEFSETCPSTPGQLVLGKSIAEELKALGLEDARMDEYGYIYASLPANCQGQPAIGLIAHMDTSDGASGKDIKPQIVSYQGGDIQLANGSKIGAAEFEFLEKYKGQDLIVTDGNTLLGADDKAGIAEIVTAIEYLLAHPEIKHGKICIGFTPDEEIGRGADKFDIKNFGADFAYTVDGGALGELEYENFNAASAVVTINGFNVHPGSAKNKMRNSILIGQEFLNMMPAAETPACTEKYEGFYHVMSISGDETKTEIRMIIRDHDMDKFKARKKFIEKIAGFINEKYGEGTAEVILKDSYYNMKEYILPVMHVVDRASKAMKEAGVEPIIQPIRGGTDGARLSADGLPCPNLSTGGENFHGVKEFVSIQAMEKMVEILLNIVKAE